jgi:hypothetical protein
MTKYAADIPGPPGLKNIVSFPSAFPVELRRVSSSDTVRLSTGSIEFAGPYVSGTLIEPQSMPSGVCGGHSCHTMFGLDRPLVVRPGDKAAAIRTGRCHMKEREKIIGSILDIL